MVPSLPLFSFLSLTTIEGMISRYLSLTHPQLSTLQNFLNFYRMAKGKMNKEKKKGKKMNKRKGKQPGHCSICCIYWQKRGNFFKFNEKLKTKCKNLFSFGTKIISKCCNFFVILFFLLFFICCNNRKYLTVLM